MAIWTKPISTDILTTTHIATAAERLGIEFIEIGPDFVAKMGYFGTSFCGTSSEKCDYAKCRIGEDATPTQGFS